MSYYVDRMEETFFNFKEQDVAKDIERLHEKISACRDAITDINHYKIQIDSTDKRTLSKEDKEDCKQASIDANYFVKRLENIKEKAQFELNHTLESLSISSEPQDRLIALRNGYGDEKFINDPDPIIKIELIKRNLDNEDILIRFTNDDSAEVKSAILDTKSEKVLSVLAKDDNTVVRETAELLLERIEAINELSDFEKLLLIAESKGWNVEEFDNEYQNSVNFQQYSNADQDFSFDVVLQDKNDGEEYDIDDFASKLVEKTQYYYENYSPDEEAQLWIDDTGHGTNGAPYEYEDLLADMKECEGMVKDLADAFHDAYYNDNYIKHIDLTQVDLDDIKSRAAKEDKAEPKKGKTTVERD